MTEKPVRVEDKIILAAIECIEKYGISGATNRQIAQMAGVNNAAINYYFRSKDVLIQRCMEITLKNGFDLSGMPPMPAASAQERCIAVLTDLIAGGYQYPGITRAHFYNLMAEGQYDALLMKHVNAFMDDLAKDLQDRGTALAADELKIALLQIISAVLMAILAPKLFEQQQGFNLHDAEFYRAYVTRLVTHLLV
jgi:AcrR family transcriptional regulator